MDVMKVPYAAKEQDRCPGGPYIMSSGVESLGRRMSS